MSKKTTLGYKYYLGVQLAVCHGAVDSVSELIVGERLAWSGDVTASSVVRINSPELFGGERSQGGVEGDMQVYMGDSAQLQDPYLVEHCAANVPAYLDLTTVIFKSFYWAAMNPYFKAPWLRVKRILKGWHNDQVWYSTKATIGTLDMNPIHIVYQCLTSSVWGMGYSVSNLDDASFRAAADKLHAESFGMSLIWEKQMSILDFVQIVMDHINGSLRLDLKTGKFVIKLIRDGYDVNTLVELNADNILQMSSFQRMGTGELVNQLSVKWTDRNQKEQTVTVHNLATIEAQGAIVTTSREYLGIREEALAMRVAMRDLSTMSTPLAKATLVTNRVLWNKERGDEVALSWPELGIVKLPMRIISIDKGNLLNGEIQVELIEDVFALPSTTYTKPQPPLWQDTVQPPTPSTLRKVIELPYWEIQRNLSDVELADFPLGGAMLGTLSNPPNQVAFDYGIKVGAAYIEGGRGAFTATTILSESVAPAQTTLKIGTIQNSNIVELGDYALLGDEIVRVDVINPFAGTMIVGRGCLDTVTTSHLAGTPIYFAQDMFGSDQVMYLSGQNLNVKLTPRTGMGELPVISAPIDKVSMVGRFNKPYPPSKLRISGSISTTPSDMYPDEIQGQLVVSWKSRNRLIQNLEDESVGDITSESGVNYNLRVYEGSNVLVQQLNTPDLSATLNIAGIKQVRIELESVREGHISFTKHDFTFSLINTITMQGSAMCVVTAEGSMSELLMQGSASCVVTANGSMAELGMYGEALCIVTADGELTSEVLEFDPFYQQVSLLLHMDGGEGSNVFTDNSPRVKTVTSPLSGIQRNDIVKFGASSAFFAGTQYYLNVVNDGTDFTFGGDPFTIEMWVRPTAGTNGALWDQSVSASGVSLRTPVLSINGTSIKYYIGNPGASGAIIQGAITLDQWSHVALCKLPGNTRLYVNGVQVGTTFVDTQNYIQGSPNGFIGKHQFTTGSFAGHIDELRITKGVSRYDGDFTPPTKPFPNQ